MKISQVMIALKLAFHKQNQNKQLRYMTALKDFKFKKTL